MLFPHAPPQSAAVESYCVGLGATCGKAAFISQTTASGISLRWKVALSLSILLLLVSGVVGGALIRYERDSLMVEGRKRVQLLAEN